MPSIAPRRLHYYVHGRGQGHATRTLAVLAQLDALPVSVRVFAGPDAVALLRETRDVTSVESLPPTFGAPLARTLAHRTLATAGAIEHDHAELVLSDGDLPAVWSARLRRRPCIAIGRGLVFSECERPDHAPLAAWQREAKKARWSAWGATYKVAVNFVPVRARTHAAIVARPTPPAVDIRLSRDDSIVAYFRDRNGDAILRQLVASGYTVRLFGAYAARVPGVTYETAGREHFIRAVAAARGVIASAGSQLIGECLALRTPIFALHRPDDDEQALNVAFLRGANVGDGCAFEAFDPTRFAASLTRPQSSLDSWAAPDVGSAVAALCRKILRIEPLPPA